MERYPLTTFINVCLLTLLLGPLAKRGAAEPQALAISLPEALERALRQDLRSREWAAQAGALQARRRQALAPHEPNFGVLAYGPGSALAPAGSTALEADQPLGFPGKAGARADKFELQVRALDAEQRSAENEDRREVVDAYAGLWFYRQALALNRLRRADLKEVVDLARRRKVPGTTREVDYLRSEAVLDRSEDDAAQWRAGFAKEQAVLDSLMGLDPDTPLAPQAPPPDTVPTLDSAALRRALLRSSPELLAGRLTLQADRTALRSARLAALPDFDVSVQASQGQVGGGLSLSLPLWYGLNEAQGVRAAAQAVLAGEARTAEIVRRAELGVEQRRNRLVALQSQLENGRQRLLPLERKAYRLALARYPYGQVDYPSLEAAAAAWWQAQLRQERLQWDLRRTMAGLEFLLGGSRP